MKIVNLKKFIRSIIIILLVIIGLSLLISKSTYSHGEKQYKTICVSSGDTLWNIASSESNLNGYYKNRDVRYIINDIIKENNLVSSNLAINQKLKIPTIYYLCF